MKVAYVVHPRRACYELPWLAALPAEEVRILDVDFQPYPHPPKGPVKYCKVDAWDSHLFGSSARLAWYRGFESALDQVDVVLVLEAFSSLSHQFVNYCRNRAIPVAVLTYEVLPRHPIYQLFPFSHFTRVTLANAKAFVCVTSAAKRHLAVLGADPNSLVVIPPGIDTARFLPVKDASPSGGVIFVGRLERHKGVDIALETFYSLIRPHPTRHMTIVGDGSHRHAVERAATQNSNLRFFSHVPHSQMPSLYSKHDVFLLPARDSVRFGRTVGAEQFGFALVEAMACGLAVVTSDCGAIPEVVGKHNCICPQANLQEFPSYVDHALSQGHLSGIAEANRLRACRFYELRTQAERLYECLEQVSCAATH